VYEFNRTQHYSAALLALNIHLKRRPVIAQPAPARVACREAPAR
jgi:hypothetical protein